MNPTLKIDILGTEYELVESNEKEDCRLVDADGYCDTSIKKCVIDDMSNAGENSKQDLPSYQKQVKRHELIHAFLHESGLSVSSWADNEEMVDWFAIQFPKMLRAFKVAGCSED